MRLNSWLCPLAEMFTDYKPFYKFSLEDLKAFHATKFTLIWLSLPYLLRGKQANRLQLNKLIGKWIIVFLI